MTCACEKKPLLRFKKLKPSATIPDYQSEGAAGFDLHAAESGFIQSGVTELVSTGLAVEVPPGYELQIRPRSGLALKSSLLIVNSPGTVDSDYRGEVGIICHNLGLWVFYYKKGDRIAQGVLKRVEQAKIVEVQELNTTARGDGGFGSTGV